MCRERFPLAAALSVLFLTALWFVLCRQLSGEWSVNEQYNYGWFVPLFALYLFWLRWQDRPAPEVGSQKSEVRHGESVLWRTPGTPIRLRRKKNFYSWLALLQFRQILEYLLAVLGGFYAGIHLYDLTIGINDERVARG